jgi:hypothetical protein
MGAMMHKVETAGRLLNLLGVILLIAGAFLTFFEHLPLPGKVPGDILVQKKNFTLYFPLTTAIGISMVVSAVFYLLNRR